MKLNRKVYDEAFAKGKAMGMTNEEIEKKLEQEVRRARTESVARAIDDLHNKFRTSTLDIIDLVSYYTKSPDYCEGKNGNPCSTEGLLMLSLVGAELVFAEEVIKAVLGKEQYAVVLKAFASMREKVSDDRELQKRVQKIAASYHKHFADASRKILEEELNALGS